MIGCPTLQSPRVENAVVICLDTVRFDTLALVHELLGGDEASIQWRRGTSVRRAQTTAPWTLPAIASVFTGLYPNRHQAGAFETEVANLGRAWPAPLSRRIVTLADHLE